LLYSAILYTMDWQTVFYIIASIFMLTVLFLIIAVAVVAYYIRKRLMMLASLAKKPAETASEIGAGIAEGVGLKIKQWLTTKKVSPR
jgi:hypothetical protein